MFKLNAKDGKIKIPLKLVKSIVTGAAYYEMTVLKAIIHSDLLHISNSLNKSKSPTSEAIIEPV